MLMHVLIFESQPSTSEGHAIYRSLQAQMIYDLLIQILSMGLIVFGVSYKVLLQVETSMSKSKKYDGDSSSSRLLASVDLDVAEDMVFLVYSGSLTVILITLELMLITHRGAKATFEHSRLDNHWMVTELSLIHI